MRKGIQIAGIFVSDIHLSEAAPVSRAEKKNWHEVQNRVLDEISDLQEQFSAPVFFVGDIFDRYNPSPWVINNAIVHMPKQSYGIPGNHDLPNHSYIESQRSAYWTLVEAGVLKNLTPGPADTTVDHLVISSFPCGFDVRPPSTKHGLCWNVALIHAYIWTEKTGHPGAPDSHRFGKWMNKLKGYDIAVYGDNHKGFLIQKEGKCRVLNCGAAIRRKSDEISYTPSVGLLHADGKIERHYLDVSKDQWTDVGREIATLESSLEVDLCGFIEEMTELRRHGASWSKTVELWIKNNKLDSEVQAIILRAVKEST